MRKPADRVEETERAAGARAWTDAALVASIAAVYFGAARLGLSMPSVAAQVTLVWPPTGIALAAMVVFGRRAWIGVALGAFLANATTTGETSATALGIAIGNTAEAVVGAWALRRFLEFDRSLSRLRDVAGLIVLAATGATAVSATVGAASLCLGGVHPWTEFGPIWREWWQGDALGALVVAPPLLVWSVVPRALPAPRQLVEAVALVSGLVATSLVVFGGPGIEPPTSPLEYLAFPFLIWAAIRFGQRGSTAVAAVASAIAVRGTLQGTGPFHARDVHEGLALLQLFLGVMSVTGLFLSAAVHERNRAESSLRESDARFRFLADTIPSMVWTAAPDGRLLYVNERWTEYSGLTRDEIARSWPGSLVHPDDRERRMTQWELALREKREFVLEVRKRRHDGAYRWFITRAAPRKDADGRVTMWFGVTTDIHDQKVLQQRLEEADRRKDEFLATLAHELRNPLAPLSNSLRLLRVAGREDPARDEALAAAERQVGDLARLVDDLLDVSRVTRGEIALRVERVRLTDVVDRALETSRMRIDASGQSLRVTLPGEPVALDADPTRLAQVVSNLLINAAKYGQRGGRIVLAAEVRSRGPGDCRELVLAVEDTGIGIAADVLPRIFEPFMQVDPSLERSQGGLGIGLTLVKRIVESHGGAVEALSEGPGRGSRFVVRLPLPATEAPARTPVPGPQPAAPAAPAPSRAQGRVLVVDDNRDSAQTMSLLLRRLGYEVETAYDGIDAVEAAARFEPDAVLLDVGLPRIDGHEAARRIRSLPRGRSALLIAMTGWGKDEDRRRSKDAGFDHHLVKPIDHAVLDGLLAGLRPDPDEARRPVRAADDGPRTDPALPARISHELRTPLNTLFAATQILADSPLDADQRAAVRSLRSGGEALRAILDELLGVARVQAPSSAGGRQEGSAAGPARSLRVLVTDDDAASRLLASRILAALGCSVDEAAGGAEALERLSRESYDVVLVDLRMPGLDGVRAVREMRRTAEPGCRPSVIATTASTMREDHEALMAAGADACIVKPLTADTLRAVLARVRAPAAAAGAAGPASEVVDAAVLDDLRPLRTRDGRFVVDALIDLFVEEAPAQLSLLHDAAARGDAAAIAAAAHKLRGVSASVGARRLASLARSAETSAREDDAAAATAVVAAMEAAWIEARESLRRPAP